MSWWPTAWHWLRSISTEHALTFGLLVFAGVQVGVAWWGERNRRRERRADEGVRSAQLAQEFAVAHGIVSAEYFRLTRVLQYWQREGVLELAMRGLLSPEDVEPRNWTALSEALGRLHPMAGQLGAFALGRLAEIRQHVAELASFVARSDTDVSDVKARRVMLELRGGEVLQQNIQGIEQRLRESALLISDALRVRGEFNKPGQTLAAIPFRSEDAKRFVAALEARNPAAALEELAEHDRTAPRSPSTPDPDGRSS